MKLFIYDKFWDAFIDLNKTTQKKVLDFQKKFRENSKSAAIHLEPISTFRDQSLRTARIDQKYRAIVKVPETGSAYYLLWVDNHDEAMDWARDKMFEWNETTQSIQVFTVPDEAVLPSASDKAPVPKPAVTQGLGKYTLEQLKGLGVPEILLPSVQKVSSLDQLEKMQAYLPEAVFENLFYLMDGAQIDLLLHEVKEGTINSDNPDETAESANNRRSFVELTDDDMFNEVLSGSLDKWKYYLHPSQRKLVNGHFQGPTKVTGGAGTGKTVAALHRLKVLAGQASVDQPVLFTTFTKALTKNLIALANGLKVPTERVRIVHIDLLVFELAKEYEIISDQAKIFGFAGVKKASDVWEEILEETLVTYDRDFLEKEYEQVILYHNIGDRSDYLRIARLGRGKAISRRQRAELWKVFELFKARAKQYDCFYKEEVFNQVTDHFTQNEIHPFSAAVVDELQDMSNVELRFIRSLVTEKPNDLFLVGDPLQTIYAKRINFTKAGINVRGKRSLRLRINYRTTEEIKKLAVSIIEDCHYDNFDGEEEEKNGYVSLFHGQKPSYQLFKTKADEVDAVLSRIEKLIEAGIDYPEIAIASRSRSGLKDFTDALHKQNLPYYEMHSGKAVGQKNGIHLFTLHSIKGLEFKHVFLVDVNNRTAPKQFTGFDDMDAESKAMYLRAEKSLMYVAASRAIEGLCISGVGQASEVVRV